MISRTRRIVDSIMLVIVAVVALAVGQCYLTVDYSKDCNVLLEYTKISATMFGESESERMGSGVLISEDGWVLTAGHCVRDVNNLRVTLGDGQSYKVSEYWVPEDANVDFGLIKLPITVDKFRPLADSNGISGWVYSIGTPNGIWDAKFICGKVYSSNFKRRVLKDVQFILATLPVAHGCSGGGVYRYNRLIGIVSMLPEEGACLVVPSSVIQKLRSSCVVHKTGWEQKDTK